MKIFIAGHRGMVGSAIRRHLLAAGQPESRLLTRSRDELDLMDQRAVQAFFESERPEQVYLAAARVGGIHANNTYPAEFIYQNLVIEANVIDAAFRAGVRKLLFLGSSCIYPKHAPQPIREEALLTGPLEPTNEPYALAKIAGIKLCQSYNRQYGASHGLDYRSVMPTNLYGPGDNYHSENSHVIPALIRRFHEARVEGAGRVEIWGTGTPLREFLHVDDLAAACVLVMNAERSAYDRQLGDAASHLNVGSGEEVSISSLAHLIARTIGYQGDIAFDPGKPDGTHRKLMDSSRIRGLGWCPAIGLEAGLKMAYDDFASPTALRTR